MRQGINLFYKPPPTSSPPLRKQQSLTASSSPASHAASAQPRDLGPGPRVTRQHSLSPSASRYIYKQHSISIRSATGENLRTYLYL